MPISMENSSSDFLLIFQAPGESEWEKKEPICSEHCNSSAARIRNFLSRLGKSRYHFDITNTTQCYPVKLKSGRDKKPVTALGGHVQIG